MPAARETRWLRRAKIWVSAPGVRLAIFAAIALAAAWRPLGDAGAMNEFRDSHLIHTYEDVAVRTVRDYGQLPLWNPWSCGGMYGLGNPQSRFASPTFLLSLALGARRAEPLILFFFLILGMEGAFRFARLRNPEALGPFVAAPFFALTGYGAVSWSLGWMGYLCGFLLVPWSLLGTARLARGEVGGAVPLIGSAATMIGMGSSYPLALAAVFSTLEAVRGLWPMLRLRHLSELARRTATLAAAALLCAGVGAFRLWPIAQVLRASPRIVAGAPGHRIPEIVSMLLGPAPSGGGSTAIMAVAPVALLFALASVLCLRRSFAPLILFGFAVWCATGHAGYSPYTWLRHLPVFETLRYPERFLFPGIAYLAEAAAMGFSALLALSRPPRRKWAGARSAIASAALVLGIGGWGYAVFTFERLTRRSELGPMPPRIDQPFAQARGNRWIASHYPFLNRGSIACGEGFPVWMSGALRGDLPQEEFPEDPSAGTVRRIHWSPNALTLDVQLSRPSSVVINQNWHPGWRSSIGTVEPANGLLAVRMPEGEHRLELRFRSRSAIGGAVVSLLALAATLTWLMLARRKGREFAARIGLLLALVPSLTWGVLYEAMRDAPQLPSIQNRDGSPLLVDSVPPDRTVPDMRWDLPLSLVAMRLPDRPDENGEVPVELYWHLSGDVPRTIGIFVHVVGPGQGHNADHEVLGGTWFFKNAPRDHLIRDAFRLNASDWEAGEWRVLLGLWHASGDQTRVLITDRHGVPLEGRYAVLGTIKVEKPRPSDPRPE